MFSGSKYFKTLPVLLLTLISCLRARAADKDSTRIIMLPTDAFVGNTSFNHRNDSLFKAGDYATIIDNYYKADQTTVYELIGAFYALGSPIESYKQLLTEIYYYNDSLYGNAGAAFIHVNNDAEAWLYYLSFPKNKRLVDSLLLEVYGQEKVTAPQYGRNLFRYLINDQYSRMLWMHTYYCLVTKKLSGTGNRIQRSTYIPYRTMQIWSLSFINLRVTFSVNRN